MSAQVQKLEALLSRVQRNRKLVRGAGAGVRAAEDVIEDPPSLVPEPASVAPVPPPHQFQPPVPRPAAARPAAQEPAPSPARASRGARTPLERAVEDKLDRPSTLPQMSVPQRPPAPAVSEEPITLADPPVPAVGKTVAQVVSKAPQISAQSFGDLLRRSLSLRAR